MESTCKHALMGARLLLVAVAALTVSQVSAQVGTDDGYVVNPTSYLDQIRGPNYAVADYWRNFRQSPDHEAIVATAPDTWKVLPKEFDPNYKNPCWTENGRFRCIPYFQILGVSKCGTTDLFARLKRHPELADGSKGPHFWDECPYPPQGACTAPPHGDFDGYADLFEKGAAQIKSNPTWICGEASSNTFTGVYTYVRGLAVRKGTNVTMAKLIREAQPYQRQIVLFREPVSRYYSAFHYYGHRRADGFQGPEKFHERAVQEIGRWNDCLKANDRLTCLKRYDPQQLVKGMYAEFVEPWTSIFPRDQILFLRNEDYQAAPRQHIQAVMRFLGLRDLSEDEWVKVLGVERTNAQSTRYPRMLPETRRLLEDFYSPYNQKLAELLNDNRFLWKDTQQRIANAMRANAGK